MEPSAVADADAAAAAAGAMAETPHQSVSWNRKSGTFSIYMPKHLDKDFYPFLLSIKENFIR